LSHIVKIQTKIRDTTAVNAACSRLGIPAARTGKACIYGTNYEGTVVQLPGWQYPIVIDPTTGEVKYDNYGGAWGKQEELDKFLQRYAAEKAKAEARKKGMSVTEEQMTDGSLKIKIVDNS